uniref:MraY family glycosyltransferase n=1 Tax=Roseihalotalea indica TaxID=2867963 RepID=A0AA49GRB2_9BACT|nr:MraY family glycosyltransferase [Tunicatimonas sp. TK19036]
MPMPLIDHPGVILFIALLSSCAITMVIIPVVIRVAHEKHLMEEPNGRSSHWEKTPSLGGVAIFVAIATVFMVMSHWASPNNTTLFFILPSLVILFFIGLKDDILIIDPYKKLTAQLLAGGIFIALTGIRISNMYGVFGIYELPYEISFVFTLFIFVAITNAYNLIDGIDGLAGCLGIVAATAYGIYYLQVDMVWITVLCATLAGALTGFLRFNFSASQKIFMGDSGSLIVGFILSVLTIKFIQVNESPNPLYISNAPTIAIAILALPLLDTLRVFSHRLMKGNSPFSADRNHIHHLVVDNGFSHMQSSIILSLISVAIIAISFSFFAQSPVLISLIGIALISLVYVLLAQRSLLVRKPKMFVQKRVATPKPARAFEQQPQSASAAS